MLFRDSSTLLSPRQVALAIGVSESSLKRWCDRGLLPTVRTAGGHRRLPVEGVLEFLRQHPHPLVHPEVLGLPARNTPEPLPLPEAAEAYCQALVAADEEQCRKLLLDVYLSKCRLSVLGDQVVAVAFRQLGRHWERGELEVYQERWACEITRQTLYDLRSLVGSPPSSAPLALGGTPAGDCYTLPPRLVELVLRECGWRARSLGSSLPLSSLTNALLQKRPRLCWLSVSHIANLSEFLHGWAELSEAAAGQGIPIVVGGQALTAEIRQQMPYGTHATTLEELEALVERLARAELTDAP